MNIAQQVAKHLRDVHFGGNWTSVNLTDTLADVTWQEATAKVHSFNTILILVCHISYYVTAVSKVLEGEALNAKDEYSFAHPPVHSQQDWEDVLNATWQSAERFAVLIEQMPEQRFGEVFTDIKYGTYYRNLQGIIEHTHYHLGQIVFIKKMLRTQ